MESPAGARPRTRSKKWQRGAVTDWPQPRDPLPCTTLGGEDVEQPDMKKMSLGKGGENGLFYSFYFPLLDQ